MTYAENPITPVTAPTTLHVAIDRYTGLVLGVYATRNEADAVEATTSSNPAHLAYLEAA